MQQLDEGTQANYDILRDCVCEPIVNKTRAHASHATKRKARSQRKKAQSMTRPVESDSNNAEELADFVNYLTAELFASLPSELRTISFAAIRSDEKRSQSYLVPLPTSTVTSLLANVPLSVIDSLEAYHLIEPGSEKNLLVPVLQDYVNTATSPPPTYNPSVRGTACEICERNWMPLSYHHLIPREVHAKALRRGWHEEWELQSVAWLCRACHGFVHKIEPNEELAKNWFTIERLISREDVREWAQWIGRVRWKAR